VTRSELDAVDLPETDPPAPADVAAAVGASAGGRARQGNGGMPGRRAVVRWAWRMFRREWRQQALVLALVTVSVTAAVTFAVAMHAVAPVSAQAEFGTANAFVRFLEPDPATLPDKVQAAADWFGTIDVIGHRTVPIPGSVDELDLRSQDPDGPYSDPMLDLLDGRYPAAAGEVAVTDDVADQFDVGIGDAMVIDGVERTVVGRVENPSDLGDEFALVPSSTDVALDSLTVLVSADEQRLLEFRAPGEEGRMIGLRGDFDEGIAAAIAALAVVTVALLLVGLVAAASFVALAQRRQRQLGVLAAVGATGNHLRLVMVASGALIGAVGSVIGAVAGSALWFAIVPRVERAAGFRVSAALPWWLVAANVGLAVVATTLAAWWPARAAARLPVVAALSSRPPRPVPARRSVALAGVVAAGGVSGLAYVDHATEDGHFGTAAALLLVVGMVATIVGTLLLCPAVIRLVARQARRFPIAVRLPLRDLARYQGRSAAALAAVALALGIPVAIIVTAASAAHGAEAGNLSDDQLLIRTDGPDGPFAPEAADVAPLQAGVDAIVAAIDGVTVAALDVATNPATSEGGSPAEGRRVISIDSPVDDGWRWVSSLYVATPDVLAVVGLDAADLVGGSGLFTSETGDLRIIDGAGPRDFDQLDPETMEATTIPGSGYSSVPSTFVTPEELARRGWEAVPSGTWMIVSPDGFTDEELDTARDIAAGAGLAIETRDHQEGLTTLRAGATAVGALLGLGILAMTVGLLRTEAAADVRTLTATGATSAVRRTMTATTAGGLAFFGVVLGGLGAYVALVAGTVLGLDDVRDVPVVELLVLVAGTPLCAAAAGWLLAGREPAALARPVIA
jgi:putative ABC transport system permease protein